MGSSFRAFKGAFGFLTRLPIGNSEDCWEEFSMNLVTFPLVGYFIGFLISIPFLLPVPNLSAVLYVVSIYGLTGIIHLDGIADLGDALVVHGGPERKLTVMEDTVVGVGAVFSVSIVLLGLGLIGLQIAELNFFDALSILVASEVSAKLGMALTVCFGDYARNDQGMSSELISNKESKSFVLPLLATLPVILLTFPNPAGLGSIFGGMIASTIVLKWSKSKLGGVTGDVTGAANEISRIFALYSALIVWILI